MSLSEKEKVKEIVDDLLQNNIIRESNSPFVSRILLVQKQYNSDRLCVDFLSRNPVDINLIKKGSWVEIEQSRDPEVEEIITNLQENPINNSDYVLKDNLLHKRITRPNGSHFLLCYVPKQSRLSLLKIHHNETYHIDREKTLQKLRENFWFP